MDKPKVGDSGQGIWDGNSPKMPQDGGSAMSKNILSQVGSNATSVNMFDGGSAGSGNGSGGWGTGAPNKPSPDQSLLGSGNTKSPDQCSGSANKPSPDQNLLDTTGSKSASKFTVRQSSLGGMEKGVQIP